MTVNGSNNDIEASEIVSNLIVKCNGALIAALYVKDKNIWVNDKIKVDEKLIDMIGKLDIEYYGSDCKRKYRYKKSIKHIKDCITCIRANETVIDDNLYDTMIKNKKYYLPFIDDIYSFKDKKLFSYEDLRENGMGRERESDSEREKDREAGRQRKRQPQRQRDVNRYHFSQPGTFEGVHVPPQVPLPSWPSSLFPQHLTPPPAMMTHV
jgi:hypothetical protein